MGIAVTLEDYRPPARADGAAYTKARIEEAPTAEGAWTIIDTVLLAPLDTDPEHPIDRDLTTVHATGPGLYYRVSWIDAAGNVSTPSGPAQNLSELEGGIRPSVSDVAALLRARTKRMGGVEVGTFDNTTRPTADEVDRLITEAEDEVLGKVQAPATVAESAPEGEVLKYERRVRGAIRLYTAILIETSYFPEQIAKGQSAVSTYEKLFDSRIKALIAEGETGAVQGEGGEGAGGASSPADPAWSFPAGTGLIGWNTRW